MLTVTPNEAPYIKFNDMFEGNEEDSNIAHFVDEAIQEFDKAQDQFKKIKDDLAPIPDEVKAMLKVNGTSTLVEDELVALQFVQKAKMIKLINTKCANIDYVIKEILDEMNDMIFEWNELKTKLNYLANGAIENGNLIQKGERAR